MVDCLWGTVVCNCISLMSLHLISPLCSDLWLIVWHKIELAIQCSTVQQQSNIRLTTFSLWLNDELFPLYLSVLINMNLSNIKYSPWRMSLYKVSGTIACRKLHLLVTTTEPPYLLLNYLLSEIKRSHHCHVFSPSTLRWSAHCNSCVPLLYHVGRPTLAAAMSAPPHAVRQS